MARNNRIKIYKVDFKTAKDKGFYASQNWCFMVSNFTDFG